MVAHYVSDLRLCAGGMGGRNDDLLFANRALIQEIGIQATRARDIRLPLSEQLAALHTLQSQLERLQYRIRHGAPWYQRFGLERNAHLLSAAFPCYAGQQTGWCAMSQPRICSNN